MSEIIVAKHISEYASIGSEIYEDSEGSYARLIISGHFIIPDSGHTIRRSWMKLYGSPETLHALRLMGPKVDTSDIEMVLVKLDEPVTVQTERGPQQVKYKPLLREKS